VTTNSTKDVLVTRDGASSEPGSASGGATLVLEFESALTEAAATRHDQLHSLPDAEGDQVVAVQRGALEQTLAEIAAARVRLANGTFGTCTGCGQAIPADRLEFRPWSGTCVTCVGRR
jgi:RNA polymerase-binding transcription factor DksA